MTQPPQNMNRRGQARRSLTLWTGSRRSAYAAAMVAGANTITQRDGTIITDRFGNAVKMTPR